MKFHRTYHPESWSQQSRELCDQFYQWDDKTCALRGLLNSYRGNFIRRRALKRFGRLVRKDKIQNVVATAFLPRIENGCIYDIRGKFIGVVQFGAMVSLDEKIFGFLVADENGNLREATPEEIRTNEVFKAIINKPMNEYARTMLKEKTFIEEN